MTRAVAGSATGDGRPRCLSPPASRRGDAVRTRPAPEPSGTVTPCLRVYSRERRRRHRRLGCGRPRRPLATEAPLLLPPGQLAEDPSATDPRRRVKRCQIFLRAWDRRVGPVCRQLAYPLRPRFVEANRLGQCHRDENIHDVLSARRRLVRGGPMGLPYHGSLHPIFRSRTPKMPAQTSGSPVAVRQAST